MKDRDTDGLPTLAFWTFAKRAVITIAWLGLAAFALSALTGCVEMVDARAAA